MVRSSFESSYRRLFSFAVLSLFLSVSATAHDPLPVPKACPRPEAFDNVPHLREFVEQACAGMAQVLDHNTGAGTGALVGLLETYSKRITVGDIRESGLTYREFKRLINEEFGGRGVTVKVVAYSGVVERANRWLKDSGFGFFNVVQNEKAALIEAYRNATVLFPKTKGVTMDDVKRLSDVAYPDLKPHQIKLPIAPSELESASVQFKFPRYELLPDSNVPNSELVPLPPENAPLKKDEVWYRRLQAVRFGITTAVMSTATAAAAWTGQGHISPEAITVFLGGLGLEAQFIAFSKSWRSFWAKRGFAGNALVNFSYGAILASLQHLTEYAQGIPSTFDANDFLIKTSILGATFIASFGGMQVVTARMKEEGEYSEGGAMWVESVGNIINNFGRFFATTAGIAGASVALGQVGDVQFGMGEGVGWAIQGAYLLFMTAPLWIKRLYGDDVRAGLIAYDLDLHRDPDHPYNGALLGGIRHWCARKIASLTRFYTPVRTR